MIRLIKKNIARLIEKSGYRVYAKSLFGFSLADDLGRLMTRPEPSIVDAGANCGQTVTWLKRQFPTARIWSYEPDPRAYAELVREAARHLHVECIQAGLGATAGAAQFFCNQGSFTSSFLPSAPQEAALPYQEFHRQVDAVMVDVRVLRDEFARLGLDRLDLLKVDCQGFDLEVLRGAEPYLQRGDIDIVVVEVLFHPEYQGQAWFHEIMPWMIDKGYNFCGLYDVMHAPNGRALFADALFRQREA